MEQTAAADTASNADSHASAAAADIMQIVFEDMLVTNEGQWIEANRPALLQLWRLLKQGTARFEGLVLLNQCSFHLFCSFCYRWTEDDDNVSSTNLSDTSSESSNSENNEEQNSE
jgi:hypothetical protein